MFRGCLVAWGNFPNAALEVIPNNQTSCRYHAHYPRSECGFAQYLFRSSWAAKLLDHTRLFRTSGKVKNLDRCYQQAKPRSSTSPVAAVPDMPDELLLVRG